MVCQKKIRTIKKVLKDRKQFDLYKKNLLNKRMFFIISRITNIFQLNIELEKLANLEIELSNNVSLISKWSESFKNVFSYSSNKEIKTCDWTNFGAFLYYVWNQHIFLSKKTRDQSIYNFDNFNDLNNQKNIHYQLWIDSLIDNKINNFNVYIKKVLRLF